MEDYKVDKWSTICMKNIHYSVPDTLVGKTVSVKIYSEKVVIFHGQVKVAAHERVYGVADWKIQLEHYARTLLRKPGAVQGSLALMQMPAKIQELFQIHFQDNGRDFVLLIQYAAENGFTDKDIIRSYEALRLRGVHKVSADQIKAFMHANNEPGWKWGKCACSGAPTAITADRGCGNGDPCGPDQDDGQHTGFNSNRFFKLKKYCYGLLVRKRNDYRLCQRT